MWCNDSTYSNFTCVILTTDVKNNLFGEFIQVAHYICIFVVFVLQVSKMESITFTESSDSGKLHCSTFTKFVIS